MENNDFLADVKKEGGNDPFDNLVKDTPSDSPAENEPEADKPTEGDSTPKEENIPFHKHPRWIERENELNTLREQREADAKAIAELKEQTFRRSESSDVPDWFKELYGDNQTAWQKYSEHEAAKEKEIERRILENQQKATQKQADEAARWNKWVEGEIGKLAADGLKFDRNELINTMLEYRPTDENNNFDFKAGYKIYDTLRAKEDPAKSQARKQLADNTSGSSKGDPAKKDYKTANDLRHRSWANLI